MLMTNKFLLGQNISIVKRMEVWDKRKKKEIRTLK